MNRGHSPVDLSGGLSVCFVWLTVLVSCTSCPPKAVTSTVLSESPCPECPTEAASKFLPVPNEADRDPRNGRFACNWSGENLKPGITYHVSPEGNDANDGTSLKLAFATLQQAADNVIPGDTVLVHTGTYGGIEGDEAVLRITTSGTEQAPIVFKAAPGEHPVIKNNTWQAIQVADASYIVIEGFELIGYNKELTLEFALKHKTDRDRWDTNQIGIQIWNYKTGGRSHHVIIRRNRIHDFGASGIVGSECDCVTVADNIIYGNGFYSVWGGSGILFWKPRPLVQTPGYKIVIRGNRVFDIWNYVPYIDAANVNEQLTGGAIMLDLFTQHGYAGPALIEGNVVYRNQGCGIQNYETINVDVVNNTTYENLLNAGVDWGEYCDYRSRGSRILNNIFVAGNGQTVTYVNSAIPDASFNHNLYWPEGAGAALKGPNDRYGDPQFKSVPGDSDGDHASQKGWDFHLGIGSEALDGANPEYAPSKDAKGKPRSTGKGPDLGALER